MQRNGVSLQILALLGFFELNEVDFPQLGILGEQFLDFCLQSAFIGWFVLLNQHQQFKSRQFLFHSPLSPIIRRHRTIIWNHIPISSRVRPCHDPHQSIDCVRVNGTLSFKCVRNITDPFHHSHGTVPFFFGLLLVLWHLLGRIHSTIDEWLNLTLGQSLFLKGVYVLQKGQYWFTHLLESRFVQSSPAVLFHLVRLVWSRRHRGFWNEDSHQPQH